MIRCRVNGAISVISAFATGIGSSLAIDLPLYVDADASSKEYMRNSVIGKILESADAEYRTGKKFKISVHSTIPQGKGLKSSSALVIAVLFAVFKISGIRVDNTAFLETCSSVSVDAGISITGALDDLTACYFGGLSLCDNRAGRIISRHDPPEETLAILYPQEERLSSSMGSHDWRSIKDKFGDLLELVLDGNYREAMIRNGELVSSMTGDYPELKKRLKQITGGTAFQSGKGPAIVSFAENPIVLREYPKHAEGFIVTRVSNKGVEVVPV
ncbi:MAG: shikimate kinase [Candidatus Thermoplasmatota archaeon]|nr:shikimate kinase [Candidatus Thermoplasmatota archaeon]MCL5437679.1 shikimate kinase [Candidatus Thermoplasmatota archaeon]